jgi:hypothetical protein
MRLARPLALLAVVVAAVPVLAKDAPDGQGHLRWRASYADALLEARIRNVPVLVSRHKDECSRCTRMYGAVFRNADFVTWANEHVVAFVAHNEMLHDQAEAAGPDGEKRKLCSLYPGLRCRDHVDAAVDIEHARGEGLVKIPFVELCPNTWLVSPTGEVSQVKEEEQFVASKVRARVEALQKTLGEAVPPKGFATLKYALALADEAIDAGRRKEALGHLVALTVLAPKTPHASLVALIKERLARVEEDVLYDFEEARDDKKLSVEAKRERITALRASVDVDVLGAKVPSHAAMTAWLAAK